VHVFTSFGIGSKTYCWGARESAAQKAAKAKWKLGHTSGGSDNTANVVGSLDALASAPADVMLVGQESGCDGSAIVPTPAD
jgi:hypothetical protein